MGNPNIAEASLKAGTRFPKGGGGNRRDHTQKGPHLTTILKKLLSAEWDFNDPKIKALIAKCKLKETIEVALVLRRILNGTEGDDLAIERIFERIDGKMPLIDQSQHTTIDKRTFVYLDPKAKEEQKNSTNNRIVSQLPTE